MGNSTISPGRYRHYKGNEYQVLAVATHSETLEPMVVYQAEYGDRKIWVRPASMWNEMVTKDGVTAHGSRAFQSRRSQWRLREL